MERKVIDCDRCGKEAKPSIRVYVLTGFSPCPAGGSSSPDKASVDLCVNCAGLALAEYVRSFDVDHNYDRATKFLAAYRKGGTP